jgi:hypothetical protein
MLQHVTTINSFHNWNTARTSWRARPRLVCKSTQVSSHTCPSLMKVAHPSSGIKARLGSKLGQNLWFNTKHDQIAVSVGWTFNHYNRNLNHGKYSEVPKVAKASVWSMKLPNQVSTGKLHSTCAGMPHYRIHNRSSSSVTLALTVALSDCARIGMRQPGCSVAGHTVCRRL